MTTRILATGMLAALAAAALPVHAAIDCGAGGTGTDVTSNGTTITIDGGQINMAGATLFVDFFRQDSSTNDWIDVDGDGFFGFVNPDPTFQFVDQLATQFSPAAGGNIDTWWAFNYRSVGSVNGFIEFVQYQLCGDIPQGPPSEAGIYNRYNYAADGVANYFGANPSGTPLEQCSIDGAFLDVPGSWAVQTPGVPAWNANPASAGYGLNSVPASTGNVPQLAALTADCTTAGLNFNTSEPDADTLYSVTAAWVPVALISNRGTGLEGIKFSEAQYLFTTGRLPNGENIVGATRDAGSGTRNAAMNSLNIDPSWGRGDNLGDKIALEDSDLVGPLHQPSNKGGSSRMEGAVQNNRLAVGYTGVAGSSRAARDATRGFYEVLDVCKDVDQNGDPLCDCTAGYVRPTIDAILDNCDPCTGFQIAGSGSFVVRGNIDANRDPADPMYSTNGFPLESQATADYLNNILDSIAAFEDDPFGGECGTSLMCTTSGLDCTTNGDCNAGEFCDTPRACSANGDCDSGDFCGQVVNSPGQGLAVSFFLPAATDCVQDLFFPLNYDINGALNQDLQDYTRTENGFGWGGDMPAFGTANVAGLVPIRYAQGGGARYADGQITSYVYHNGATYVTIAGGNDLSMRNRIQGDFNEDGARDLNDAAELVKAYIAPRAWQQTAPAIGAGTGTDRGDMTADNAIPEILGDFDGDGNLTKEDLRYFADGLALVGGALDRKAGAIAIDTALQAETFAFPWADTNGMIKVPVAAGSFADPTFLAPASIADYLGDTGNAYKLGDFRGDVAGRNPVAGAQPLGWDGKIDAADIDYVCANIMDWSNIDQAVFMDLSCDMDGDLDVDADDVTELVVGILGTQIGDVNLDGAKDAADTAIVDATISAGAAGCNGNASCGWADGDMDCDGDVDADDRAAIGCLSADADCDGDVDLDDHAELVGCLSGPQEGVGFVAPSASCLAIFDLAPADGDVDLADFAAFQTLFNGQ